jgi:replicative DNA helicase
MIVSDVKTLQDYRAERAVLGACLLNEGVIDEVLAIIPSPDDFEVPCHAVIYETIADMRVWCMPVNLAMVIADFRTRGQLQSAGGDLYIVGLVGYRTTPSCTSTYAVDYARSVHDDAVRRRHAAVGQKLQLGPRNQESTRLMIKTAQDALRELEPQSYDVDSEAQW